jgi:transmembrane 9 superfamily protein 2/4
MFQGTDWKANTLKTAFHYPGVIFAIFCVLNTAIWGQKSSGAVPFGTFIALFLMWFGISVPLVFVGSYFGFKKDPVTHPVITDDDEFMSINPFGPFGSTCTMILSS